MTQTEFATWMDRWVLYVGYIYDHLPEDKQKKLGQMADMLNGKNQTEVQEMAGSIKKIAEQWLDQECKTKPKMAIEPIRRVLRFIASGRAIETAHDRYTAWAK